MKPLTCGQYNKITVLYIQYVHALLTEDFVTEEKKLLRDLHELVVHFRRDM